MELVICHGETISNNIKNIHKVDATIIKANNSKKSNLSVNKKLTAFNKRDNK